MENSKNMFVNAVGVLGLVASVFFFVAPGFFSMWFGTAFAGTALVLFRICALAFVMLFVLMLHGTELIATTWVNWFVYGILLVGTGFLGYSLANGEAALQAWLFPCGGVVAILLMYFWKVNFFGN